MSNNYCPLIETRFGWPDPRSAPDPCSCGTWPNAKSHKNPSGQRGEPLGLAAVGKVSGESRASAHCHQLCLEELFLPTLWCRIYPPGMPRHLSGQNSLLLGWWEELVPTLPVSSST